jgi:hypothetical protein
VWHLLGVAQGRPQRAPPLSRGPRRQQPAPSPARQPPHRRARRRAGPRQRLPAPQLQGAAAKQQRPPCRPRRVHIYGRTYVCPALPSHHQWRRAAARAAASHARRSAVRAWRDAPRTSATTKASAAGPVRPASRGCSTQLAAVRLLTPRSGSRYASRTYSYGPMLLRIRYHLATKNPKTTSAC